MNWNKIYRDENGHATEDCLRAIEALSDYPIVLAVEETTGVGYRLIGSSENITLWLNYIKTSPLFTHYLGIPKISRER